jgi:hypothetical protein
VISIGHRADAGTLGRDLYRREVAPRHREPMGLRFFDGEWDAPLGTTTVAGTSA